MIELDAGLTDDDRPVLDAARRFAERELLPIAARCDREQAFPEELLARAREAGLMNANLPEAFGGPGLSARHSTLVTEELARACVGLGGTLCLNTMLIDVLLLVGDDEQRDVWLRRIGEGAVGAYAMTEPGAGSDVAAIATRAERTQDGYRLSGSKTWVSNAPLASFFVVFAKTRPADGHRGISAFLVDRDRAGLHVGRKLEKMGQRAAPACELFLDGVEVPRSARLGDENTGFFWAMKIFDRSRPMVAALGNGLTRRCLEEAIRYAGTRETMGRPLLAHQAIGHRIAEVGTELVASRLLALEASDRLDRGVPNTLAASCAKAFSSGLAVRAADCALQVHGGMGYSTEYPVEKLYRDAKVLQIYEGTTEIQRSIILRELTRDR